MTLHANATATIGGRERYGFAILDDEAYGRPGMHTVITADGYHHAVPRADIHQLGQTRVVPSVKPTLLYRVTEPYRLDAPWETASNYTTYEVQPGDYLVTWVSVSYHPVPASDAPYYGQVQVAAIIRHRHWVDRVIGASQVHDEYPDEKTTRTLHWYSYEMKAGVFSHGTLVQVAPADGEVYPGLVPA